MFTLLQNTVLIQKHAMSNYCSNKHPNPYSRIRPHTQTPHTQGPPTNGTSKTRRKYDQLLSFLLPPSLISLTAVPDFFLSQPQEDKSRPHAGFLSCVVHMCRAGTIRGPLTWHHAGVQVTESSHHSPTNNNPPHFSL